MLIEIGILVVSFLVLKVVLDRIFRPSNLPPGPIGLPIIGNAHQIGNEDEFHFNLTKMSRKYGKAFTLYIGSDPIVVLNTIDVVKEALIRKGEDFAGRPPSYVAHETTRGGKSIAFQTYNEYLKKHRKVAHAALRMYGEGRVELQESICHEIEELFKRLDALDGKPEDPHLNIMVTVMNVICALVFGERYELDHPDVKKVEGFINRFVYIVSHGFLINSFPWLRFFPLDINNKIEEFKILVESVLGRQCREHIESYQDGVIRDYTDALIKASKDAERKGEMEARALTQDHIVMVIFDVFGAGTETITSTLRWALLYMVAYPDVQAKVHKEIDDVFGRDRLPELKDRGQLIYLQAVLEETLRHASVLPLALPHYTMADTTVGGFNIPKDTTVILNIFAINHDPDMWKNPDNFDPTRFIDENHNLKSSADMSFLPFSAGRRGCFGQALARMELVLIFSRLMHRFRVEKPPGAPPPDLTGNLGLVIHPKHYKICLKKRD